MYTNIPVQETIEIIRNLLVENHTNSQKIEETIELLNVITKQNYFEHDQKFYTQNDGLPMGSPLSGTLANIYLNHFEKTYIHSEKNKHRKNIIYWHRYADDILILFHGTNRQLENLHKYANSINEHIKFTVELEANKSINFLDLTVIIDNKKHKFKIYRKDTQTDHTIHRTSNHPPTHKFAAYNHMLNRLNTIPMQKSDYDEEYSTIIYIAQKNGFTENGIRKLNEKIKNRIQHKMLTTMITTNEDEKRYISIEFNKNSSNILKKIFNKYKYQIAHKTSNKLQHKLKTKQNIEIDSGIYKLTCNNCPCFYIGQTGRSFATRFREHTQEINSASTNKKIKSNYAHHLITEKHKFTDINTNLQTIHRMKKSSMMDRMEEIEIYKNRNNPQILNDKLHFKTNKIYDAILYNEGNCIHT